LTPEDLIGALPRPLAEIVAGVGDSNTREQPYVLAFAEEA